MSELARPVRGWNDLRTVPALAAALVFAVAVWNLTPDPVGVFVDDGIYALIAKALIHGLGYHYAFLPGSPPAIHYPPAFPVLLAAIMKVTPEFPANVTVLKFVNPVCYALGVYGAIRLGVRALGLAAAPASAAVVICALIAPVLMLTDVLMSEPLFFAVLVWALIAVEDAVAQGGSKRALGAAALCALLLLVRTAGGVLVPSAAAALWLRGRRRESVVFVAAAVLLSAPWQLWVWSASRGFPDELRGSYGPYLEWMIGGYRQDPSLLWRVAGHNVAALWGAFESFFAPRLPLALKVTAASVFVAAFAVGLAVVARRATALALFGLLYGVMVVIWPYSPIRFVGAVWPLAGLILLAAMRAMNDRFRERHSGLSRAAAFAVLLLFAGHAAYVVRGLSRGSASMAQRGQTDILWPLVQWASVHAKPGDVVASNAPVMIALYTGLTTVPISVLTPGEYLVDKTPPVMAAELGALYDRYHPTLLVLVRGTAEHGAVPLWASSPGAPSVIALPDSPG
ncbi:MAG: hypothetical protein ACHQQR_05200, partial [Gemmatimonadales bacterium]